VPKGGQIDVVGDPPPSCRAGRDAGSIVLPLASVNTLVLQMDDHLGASMVRSLRRAGTEQSSRTWRCIARHNPVAFVRYRIPACSCRPGCFARPRSIGSRMFWTSRRDLVPGEPARRTIHRATWKEQIPDIHRLARSRRAGMPWRGRMRRLLHCRFCAVTAHVAEQQSPRHGTNPPRPCRPVRRREHRKARSLPVQRQQCFASCEKRVA
jgi:hypothetical protein